MTKNQVLFFCVAIIVLCIVSMIITGSGSTGGASITIGG